MTASRYVTVYMSSWRYEYYTVAYFLFIYLFINAQVSYVAFRRENLKQYR